MRLTSTPPTNLEDIIAYVKRHWRVGLAATLFLVTFIGTFYLVVKGLSIVIGTSWLTVFLWILVWNLFTFLFGFLKAVQA